MRKLNGCAGWRFSMVEMIVVTAVVSVMASMLLPALAKARQKAEYGRWMAQRSQLRADESLIAYWDMEDVMADRLPNLALGLEVERYEGADMDGRIVNADFSTADGRWPGKGALFFRGNNSHVYTTANTGLDPKAGTVALWCRARPGAWQDGDTLLFDCSTGAGDSLISLTALYGDFGVSIGDRAFVSTGRSLSDGLWHHCVLTWEDGIYRVYLDGEAVGQGSYSGMTGLSSRYGIGRMYGMDMASGTPLMGASSFDGWIDEVAVYNRAFDAQDVRDQYRNGMP